MRASLSAKLLLQLLHASPEKLTAVERFLAGEPFPSLPEKDSDVQASQAAGVDSVLGGTRSDSCYYFRRKGMLWQIVFAGRQPFWFKDSLGIRYLDHLLHHPNEPISAFDLEVAITPEKGELRSRNSIQPESDPRARREYRQALRGLQTERGRAQAAGDRAKLERLQGQIEAIEAALNQRGKNTDAGERARINVHKAIKLVLSNLLSDGEDQRAYARHIQGAVSLGYKCLYNQPQGRIWQ